MICLDDISASLKKRLIHHIGYIVSKNGFTQTQAAKEMSISRSRFCRIMGGHIKDVGEGRLIKCLLDLGYDIQITITPSQEKPGKVDVSGPDPHA